MKLAIYGSRRQESYIAQIEAFLNKLTQRGDEVVMHTKLYHYLTHLIPKSLACVRRVIDSEDFTADFAVSIGGDGSFLRTAAWVADKEIPTIGVNTGHLGFLASINIDELQNLPEALESDSVSIESRNLIEVDCHKINGWRYALNEVTISKSETSSIINVKTKIDGIELADYRADGLIIATPTGSTAYNLSVGGPIVQPTAPVFILSPIAAHSLSMRPLVIDNTSEIELTCESRSPHFRINIDGRSITLDLDTKITLRCAPFTTKVVKLPGHDFAITLRNKLQWANT